MGTLKDHAQAYEPKQLKNITELEVVRCDLETKEETFGEGAEAFKALIAVVDGEKYRVPVSVLKSLKAILKVKPELTTFQVSKTGQGMNTEYTVIPLS